MIRFHVLNASGHLGKHEALLHALCESGVVEIRKHLAVDDVDVTLQYNPAATIPEVGMSGYSPNGNLVQISLDPSNPNFECILEEELTATLAHELHHCMRWRGPGYGTILGEALITEGLARHFETTFRPMQKLPSYHRLLSQQQIQHLLSIVKEERLRPYNHTEWFFVGSESKRIPPFAGYTLGYEVVGKFIENTGSSSGKLWNEPAESFYERLW